MRRKCKQRASKRLVNIDTPIDQEEFISPNSRKIYRTVCTHRNVVHGSTTQNAPEVCCHLALLSMFGLDDFLV